MEQEDLAEEEEEESKKSLRKDFIKTSTHFQIIKVQDIIIRND